MKLRVAYAKCRYKDRVYETPLVVTSYRDEHGTSRNKTIVSLAKLPKYIVKLVEEGLKRGDASTELYVILGGNVVLRDGPAEVARLGAGEMFGEMALVNSQSRTATAVALETTSAFVLSEDTFQRLMTKRVALRLLLNMLGTMAKRLQVANEKLRAYEQR